jgi:N-sulfoglucosamine sulfohydrolase
MFSRLLSVVSFLLLALTACSAERPNLLWISVEDMSPNLGCYGDTYARTPNLDRFATESVRYTRAFATAPVCSPSRSCLITGRYASTTGTHQMRSDFPLPDDVHAWPALLRNAGYFTTNNVKTDYNTSSEKRLVEEAWNASSPTAHWRNRPDPDQPFFAVFNDMTTHQSRTMVWPYAQFQKEIQAHLSPDEIHDPEQAPLPPYYFDTPVTRRTVARYYDCVTAMDKNTGEILRQLEQDGLADNTIVVFFSDHGAGMPRHKRLLHDSGMQVALLIRFPEKYQHLAPAKPGETIDQLVSFVDFPPAMLSLLGLDIPAQFQGIAFLGERAIGSEPRQVIYGCRDRVDEVFDCSRSARDADFLYIRNFMPHLSWCQHSVYSDQGEIRAEFFKERDPKTLTPTQAHFLSPRRPIEELYAVKNDPLQTKNVAGDPDHATALAKMRTALRTQILENNDLGFRPEAHQQVEAPLETLLAAAECVGRPDKETEALANLKSPLAGVRYWAAIALHSIPDRSEAATAALETGLDDSSPAVRIECASILGNLDTLVAELAAPDPLIVLHAARALERLAPSNLTVRPALRRTLDLWKDRKDTPLALFIRFTCEASLGIHSSY